MARIIITVIFLIAIAILIILNIGSGAPVNLFGWKVEEMPVSVVAIISFVAGVLYSFIFYLMSYIERGRRDRLAKRKMRLRNQEAELKTRQQEVGELAQETKKQIESARRSEPTQPEAGAAASSARTGSDRTGGLFSGLFGRKRK
jgi:uncharacterized integral membrane protein